MYFASLTKVIRDVQTSLLGKYTNFWIKTPEMEQHLSTNFWKKVKRGNCCLYLEKEGKKLKTFQKSIECMNQNPQ